jgi:hypothetical protein
MSIIEVIASDVGALEEREPLDALPVKVQRMARRTGLMRGLHMLLRNTELTEIRYILYEFLFGRPFTSSLDLSVSECIALQNALAGDGASELRKMLWEMLNDSIQQPGATEERSLETVSGLPALQ